MEVYDQNLNIILREAIDRTRDRLGLKTYRQVADHFGVSLKQISRWRNGRWQGNDHALIAIMVQGTMTEKTRTS